MAGRVVVGTDFSDSAASALRWAAGEAALRGATLEVIHAWDYPYVERLGDEVLIELEGRARAELDAAVDTVVGDPEVIDVVRRVVRGRPAAALIEANTDADILVVGSRGRGGFTGMLLGSVGQHCAQHARCPVVIVRDGVDTIDPGEGE